MLKVAIVGAAGRMGRTLVEAVHQNNSTMCVSVATVLADDPALGVDIGLLSVGAALGVKTVVGVDQEGPDFDVLVDFTSPEATMDHLVYCFHIRRSRRYAHARNTRKYTMAHRTEHD